MKEEKKLNMDDFMKQYKTYTIGDFVFKEPTVKKTKLLRNYFNNTVKNSNDLAFIKFTKKIFGKKEPTEIEFYIEFLSKILEEGTEEQLKEQIEAMPLNQSTKFFFYVLEQLGINFLPAPNQR